MKPIIKYYLNQKWFWKMGKGARLPILISKTTKEFTMSWQVKFQQRQPLMSCIRRKFQHRLYCPEKILHISRLYKHVIRYGFQRYADFLFSGSLKTLGRLFQHFPFSAAAVVGFGINLEHGFAVCALEIVGQEIVPAVQAAVALWVGVDDVTAAGEGLNIVGTDTPDFGVGEGDVGQRAVCQAVGGAQ